MFFLSTYCNYLLQGYWRCTVEKPKAGTTVAWRNSCHEGKDLCSCVYACFCLSSQSAFCVCWVTYFNIIVDLPRLILWVCLVKNVAHLENCNMLKLAFSLSLNLLKYLTNLSQNTAKLNSSVFNNASCLRLLFLL